MKLPELKIAIEIKEFKCTKVIRLHNLANRLGWTQHKILSILNDDFGFSLPYNKPYQYLGSDHLEAISKFYVQAVNAYQADRAKKISSLSQKALFGIRKFLKLFVNSVDYEQQLASLRTIYKVDNEDTQRFYDTFYIGYDPIFITPAPDVLFVKLDTVRIKDFFFRLVYEFEISYLKDIKSILRSIQMTIRQVYRDGRRRIFLHTFSYRYHSFTSDEEPADEAHFLDRFSVVRNYLREALINSFIYFRQLKTCKTLTYQLSLRV